MNIMSRFTLKSMAANRKWTVVTLIGIIISTAMITAVGSLCASTLSLMKNEIVATNGRWHAKFSEVPLESIAPLLESRFEVGLSRDLGYSALPKVNNPNKPYLSVRLFDKGGQAHFPVDILEGRLPKTAGEIALPEHLEKEGKISYKVGDIVTLALGDRKDQDGHILDSTQPYQRPDSAQGPERLHITGTHTFTISGIFKRPLFEVSWAPAYSAYGLLDVSCLADNIPVTATILAPGSVKDFYEQVDDLATRMGFDTQLISYNKDLLLASGITGSDAVKRTLYTFSGIFIAVIVVASVSLIYNAFSISVSERISQLGMLGSVGATRRQKLHSVYFEALVLGLAGVPVGVLAGLIGIGVTLSFLGPMMTSFIQFTSPEGLTLQVSLPAIGAACLVAGLTIFISAWIPARRASKITPIDAVRQLKEIQLSRKEVRTSRLFRFLFGFEGDIALKNLKRSRKKGRATILSLTISLVLFLVVSFYVQEVRQATETVGAGYNYNLLVTFKNVPSLEATEKTAQIREIPGVKNAVSFRSFRRRLSPEVSQLSSLIKDLYYEEGRDLWFSASINGLDDASFDQYARGLGQDPSAYKDPRNPRVIVVNFGQQTIGGKFTSGPILSVKPGDTLRCYLERLDEEGTALLVGHITTERPPGILVSRLPSIEFITSEPVFQALKSPSEEPPSLRFVGVDAQDPYDAELAVFDIMEGVTGTVEVFNVAAMTQNERDFMVVLGTFIYGFIVLMSLICVANIFNTVTTNVKLRRREFAMLRSVGMTPKSFNRMIRFESIFYGFKALLYGLPVSAGISWYLYRSSRDIFAYGFRLPLGDYATAVVLVFVIVGAAMLYSMARIKKENIIDALKTEVM